MKPHREEVKKLLCSYEEGEMEKIKEVLERARIKKEGKGKSSPLDNQEVEVLRKIERKLKRKEPLSRIETEIYNNFLIKNNQEMKGGLK